MAEPVEGLTSGAVAENVALSNAVGWPDTEAEWQVIYDAARAYGVRRAGDAQLIGQGVLGVFEGTGSIAKMVVAPSAQRQGIGARLLDRLLVEAEALGLARLGLVATPFGRRLYESRGFVATGDVVIAIGTPSLDAPRVGELEVETAAVADAEQIVSLERRFMTTARVAVLRGRLAQACATARCPGGFALATFHERGTRVGPIIAENEATARALTRAIVRAAPGPLRFDVPGDRAEFRAWLRGLGLVEKGVHTEMARGGALPWQVPARFGLATQAWG